MLALLPIRKNKDLQLSILLVVFYISEASTKIAYYSKASFHNFSALIKAGFILFTLIYSINYLTKKRKKILLFLVYMSVFFLIGQFTYNLNNFGVNFFKNLIFFSRYIFAFVIILYFIDFPFNYKTRNYLKVYEKIVLFNSLLIVIGLVFNLDIFNTYAKRFGYNGFFLVPSIATFFYAIALSYFAHNYVKYNKKLVEFLVIIIVSLFVGTKALLLFLALTLIHVFIAKKIYKLKMFYVLSTLSALLIVINLNTIIDFLKVKFNVIFNVYQEYGLITMLTSYRNLKLKNNFLSIIQEKWNLSNYFFGGTDFVKYRIEFEIFDVFLFFGIIGSIVYLGFYFKTIFKFSQITIFGRIQIVFLLLIALLSGTFFNNAPVALYLLVVLSSLNLHPLKYY